ncbi:MAG TPA: hypothetical protein VE783_02490 [Candidatus Limnocylindrales bacterium]|jgi:hypothetical protein|nr:hypothetical protein [Candidatus Limnocylindrales bacterium]
MTITFSTAVRCLAALLSLVAVVLASGCAGASAARGYTFHANNITRVSYDPKLCTQLPDGAFRCKNVVFTVNAITPEQK